MGLLICAIEKPSNNVFIALLKLPYLLDVAAESKHSAVPYSSKHIDEAASNDDDDDYATDAWMKLNFQKVASLLHDDVLDDAETRRGIGSLNCFMGNKMFMPHEVIRTHYNGLQLVDPPDKRCKVYSIGLGMSERGFF
ncbi:hypothetical protein C5167_011266 [Papaver somniferum]|uniref:Uncharacterized protein n=1 Tax=Papaver somniferum TaxID=3469 RepID=A0A4Y7K6E6_PAPSO|nr:hypothetical protein C5167_011266 [Papaver somniferum]